MILLTSVILITLAVVFHQKLIFTFLVPQYIEWAEDIEVQGLNSGQALDSDGITLAKDIGIKHPEKVRIIYVDVVPYPYENTALRLLGEALGFIGEGIVNNAQVFGYSIYVRHGFELDRPKLAHELVHVLQVERSNLADVTKQHLADLAEYGYDNAPLEVEAAQANKDYAIE